MKTMIIDIYGFPITWFSIIFGRYDSVKEVIEKELNAILKESNQRAEVYLISSQAADKKSVRAEIKCEEGFIGSDLVKREEFRQIFQKNLKEIAGNGNIRVMLKYEKWRDIKSRFD